MQKILYVFVFFQGFLVSFIIIPWLIRIALKYNIVDKPGERKVHHKTKPLLGGVAIFLGFIVVIVGNLTGFFLFATHNWITELFPFLIDILPDLPLVMKKLAIILLGSFLMHSIGFIDDFYKGHLTYKSKFVAQFAVATLVALLGVRTTFMPGQTLDVVITILWIVGMTNSFNLLDNLDGLTAGVAVISALILFGVAIVQNQFFFAFMLVALAGSSFGFLLYNFHPSKLFMGDSGSLFLGYVFSVLTVEGSYVVKTSSSLLPIIMPILVLSIPLYDTFSVMFIRWKENRPLFEGDKRHFSHRLLEVGLSHRGAVCFIYLVCLGVGITATLLPYVTFTGSIILLGQAIIVYILVTILIATGIKNQKATE